MVLKLDEKILIYRVCLKKDPEAFGQLYDLYIEKIYRFIYFKISSKEETEDLTSEVFLKVWRYLIDGTGKSVSSFSGLVYKVARNSLIDFYREKAKRQERLIDFTDSTKDIGDEFGVEKLESGIDARKLIQQIKKLKHDYQEVLMLRYVEDLSVSEIAEIVDKSSLSVRVLLHRATRKLKDLSESKNQK